MKRRSVIKAISTASIVSISGASISGCGSSNAPTPDSLLPSPSNPGDQDGIANINVAFEHGVASGDPLADAVVLWTRVTPESPTFNGSLDVDVFVAKDELFNDIVATSKVTTDAARDYTVKVDAQGLQPDTWYYYFFSSNGVTSPVGRTRTFAPTSTAIDRARFAVVSCANWEHGLFSVYTAVANNPDLDFVLHLGDYVYEYENGTYGDPENVPDRLHEPNVEMFELAHYRTRHGQYKTDIDLQRVHQQYPMICVWDDHEFTDNAYHDGAGNHQPELEGDWMTRKDNAIQAYFEWMPLRAHPDDKERIYRDFQFGDLIDLYMLDTRYEGRDLQVEDVTSDEVNDPERTLISAEQMTWLRDGLKNSTSQWKMIGQQVMFGQLNIAELPNISVVGEETIRQGLNTDQWDGYTADRTKVMNTIQGFSGNAEPESTDLPNHDPVDNVVIFTGDIHTSWANEIYRNPATLVGDLFDTPMAAEFVCPSVTSPGFPQGAAEAVSLALAANSHMKYTELSSRGFILVDVTRERTQAEYYYVESISDETRKGALVDEKTKLVAVNNGSSFIQEAGLTASKPRSMQTAMNYPKISGDIEQQAAQALADQWNLVRGLS